MKNVFIWLLLIFCVCAGATAAANGEDFQASCPHDSLAYGTEERLVYIRDSEYHMWYTTRPVYCGICGEYLGDEEYDQMEEEHQFDDTGCCTVCGCVKNCKHPNAVRDYSLQMPSSIMNPEYHAIEDLIRYYCPDCGELYWETVPGSAVYSPHEFDEDGYCMRCGYNKNTGKFSPRQTEVDPASTKGTITVGDRIIAPIKLKIRLLDSADSRHPTYAGPGKEYESTGWYQPMKIRSMYAWFIEGDYVLTDVSYETIKRCTVYLKKSAFISVDGVPEIDLNQLAQPGTVTTDTLPSLFPRNNRRMYEEKTVKLSAGAPVTVFFEKDGWYYCEFTSKNRKPARGWIQTKSVNLTNGQ